MSVEGKVVLITGAARGMGREHVRGFLKAGAKVIAADLSWVPSGVSSDDSSFRDEIEANPAVLVQTMDLSLDSHVQMAFEAAMTRFGKVDAVLNNAGLRQRNLYPPSGATWTWETDVSEWQRMYDTHVFGVLRVIKAFIQPMLANRRGSIINVGSGGWDGSNPSTREQPYKSAKAAVANMTFYLADELKQHNIAANLLVPGHTRSTGSDEQEAGRAAIHAQEHPNETFLRVRLRPDHVVPAAIFLADQDSTGITGQEVVAIEWNEMNGLGGREAWSYEPDLAAAKSTRSA
jgi:NAD(P)-dependent dehydrogenase (short-subunit alcohol dehydrogenase family)